MLVVILNGDFGTILVGWFSSAVRVFFFLTLHGVLMLLYLLKFIPSCHDLIDLNVCVYTIYVYI